MSVLGPHGEGTAREGTPIDDERAERRWVAYAWPIEALRLNLRHPPSAGYPPWKPLYV
jgi:hypothetical protein